MNESVKLRIGAGNRESCETDDVKIPSAVCGLTEEEAARSRRHYGANRLEGKKQAGFFRQFLRNLNDPIIKILIAALVINTAFTFSDHNWAESAGIALTVLISAFVTTLSEHSSGKAFQELYTTMDGSVCHVLRNGTEHILPVSDVVRYDLVLLHPGDTVPADGILIQGNAACDESPLTGESRKVSKEPNAVLLGELRRSGAAPALQPGSDSALFRGSHVVSGNGVMLVLAVGSQTLYGSIASELSEEETASPLKNRLSALARTISRIGYISAILVALVHLADAFWFEAGANPAVALARLRDFRFVLPELIRALTMAISVVVVAVPEGLPMMITVVLSSNMKRMLKSGVLVRRLVGIETAGSIDILFTDKTGTLTTGQLTVTEFCTAGERYPSWKRCPSPIGKSIRRGSQACASVGNQTERAIGAFAGVGSRPHSLPENRRLPFDSARKFAAAVDGDRLYLQGAAEYLLPACTAWMDENGIPRPMTEEIRSAIRDTVRHASSASARVLLHAEGMPDFLEPLKAHAPDKATPLCFVGLFLLRDEIRPEVPPAVSECREAGIQTVMLTGDNGETAAAIARECGILREGERILYAPTQSKDADESVVYVLDGETLHAMTDEEITAILPRIRVIARVTPADKSRLIRLSRDGGHIVGMTGDGINDAPALKAADVGFAMGSGTDIAREAGDIVITDDNFVSITRGVLYGRTIFASIRKFITFQLTMNLAAVGVTVLGTVFGVESPVTVIQMLWVNIIMDTLGSLAFAGEPALPSLMKAPPIRREEPILSGSMLRQIVWTGGFALLLSMYFLLSPHVRHLFPGGEAEHLTRFFALFVFLGIGIALCTRTERIQLLAGIAKNGAFAVIMPAVAAIQLLIIYFGGAVFRCVPLPPAELLRCAVFALAVIPADTIRKCLRRIRQLRRGRR